MSALLPSDAHLLAPAGGILPPGWVQPHYHGHGFANIPATIAAMLGVPAPILPPLASELWAPVAGEAPQCVVMILVDALGWRRLLRTDPDFVATWQATGGIAAPLTSICPSTTAAATTTLWTGVGPAAHGLTGTMQHVPEMGGICDVLFFRPALGDRHGELLAWGLDPTSLINAPGFAQHLAQAQVPTIVLTHESILHSPLSLIHYRGITARHAYHGASDFWLRLRQLVEAHAGQRVYISAYWSFVDTLAHLHGPDEASWESEWRSIRHLLEHEFLARLSPPARRNTLLAISADHGQIPFTPPEEFIQLHQHPALARMLHTLPAGDPRHVYLWPRAGARQDVWDYVRDHLPAFHLFDREALLDAGIYGPHIWPEVRLRMGELVMISADRPVFYWRRPSSPLYGFHAGLLPDEAIVPWLLKRLDER